MARAYVPSRAVSMRTAFFTLFLVLVQPTGLRADQPHEVQDNKDLLAMEGLEKLAELLQGLEGLSANGRTLSGVKPMGGFAQVLQGLGNGQANPGIGGFMNMAQHLRQAMNPGITVEPSIWGLFSDTASSSDDNVFRQSSSSNNGFFGYDMMNNITDWASRIPTATQMIDFIRNPIGSLAPEPLSPDVQAMLASGQAEAVFVLSLLSAIFNLVSSIFFIVSGGLGTLAASLGLIPATLGLLTVPLGVGLSADALMLTISQNMANRHEDWNQKFYKAWTNALARLGNALATLNDGPLRAQLAQYRKQLQEAADVLQTAYQRNYTQRFQAQFPIAAQAVAAARARGAALTG